MNAPALMDVTRAQLQQWEALDFIRWTALRIKHQQYESQALAEFRQRWPESPLRARLEFEAKAAISAGTSSDPTWGGPLVPAAPSSEGFAAMIHANTILGRLPGVRRVPLNRLLPVMTVGATAHWAAEGAAKPISAAAFVTVPIEFFKAETTVVVSAEWMKLSVPGADRMLRDELRDKLVEFFDEQAFDPAVTAVANDHPASLMNGAPSAAASGTSEADALSDIKALINAFNADNADAKRPVLIMAPSTAAALSVATNRDVDDGGTVFSIPVLHSSSVAGMIILLDANQVYVAEEPGIRLDAST